MSRIKKVALIEPRAPGYHVYSRIALPRLGLPLIGAMLKQRGIDVTVYCQDFVDIDYSDVLSSDLVGISTTTSTAPEGYRIAQRIREAGIPVVMGGSHVTFLPDEALQYADFCVRGEGEYTMLELVDAIESGSGFGNIAGLSYRIGDEIRHNPPRELVQDLDALPFPDLSLIRGREKMGITPIATSRGCPYNCNFCSVIKMFGRGYRQRSVDSVIEELRYLQPETVFFYDDNFAGNRERAKALLERMLSEGLTPYWTAQVRVDIARDRELLALMKRSNCYILYIGLESVNPATLQEFNKKQSVEEIIEAVRIIHEHGIMIHGMFVFGAEHDDVSDLRAAANFALRTGIDTVQFMILTPLPGTAYFDQMEREGRLLTREWHLYDGQHVVFQPAQMSPYELQKETFKAMRRFYSIYECVKMFAPPQFLRFMLKLNFNLLRGKWQDARLQMRVALRRWFYRAYGHVLIKRWEAANKDFGEKIRMLAEKARSMGAAKQTSVGKAK
ncbi:MAG: radical SAM protein [Armatimonadota bacterium]|nr:radical SAM protein [Armatimonadota bacterium]